MDLSSILSALPIGLLVFLFTVFGVKKRQAGWARAAREYPELAGQLGLVFRPPAHAKEIGLLKGRLDDHDVIVDPDDQCKMVVRLRQPTSVILRTYVLGTRAPQNRQRFDIGDAAADAAFKDRFAGEPARTQLLAERERLCALLEPFVEHRARHLKEMSVTGDSVQCSFDFGRPKHIPPDIVRELLPKMVSLAALIDDLG